jgi:phenylacetate-CoA ligase
MNDSTRERETTPSKIRDSSPAFAPRVNPRLLHTAGHGRRALLRAVSNGLMETYPGFLLRSQIVKYPQLQQYYSEQLAILEARRAYESVPAYRKFVDQRCGSFENCQRFSDLPETDKADYIKPYDAEDKTLLYVDKTILPGSSWDTSTGTSGIPTSWYRGRREVHAAYRLLSHRGKGMIGSVPISVIIAFALGPWATGMTAARAMGNNPYAVTYNVGAQPELILQLMVESRQIAPERPIVVCGYPPHIEQVVKLARSKGIPLHDHLTIAVVGGEALSELQRARIKAAPDCTVSTTGFREVYSFYGASDVDINIGMETPYEIALRDVLERNNDLARHLLGANMPFVPMIFSYDPLSHLIEVNHESQLLFTEVSGNRISPRIRYNLDKGTIRSAAEVTQALEDFGIALPIKRICQNPFVFVWGRIDDGITYRGANLAWENLETALRTLDLGDSVQGFGLLQYEDKDRLCTDFMLHVPDPTSFQSLSDDGPRLISELTETVRRLNHDFSYQIQYLEDAQDLPGLRLYHQDSPMAEHSRLNVARKQKHIFVGSDAQRAFEIENGGLLIHPGSLPA